MTGNVLSIIKKDYVKLPNHVLEQLLQLETVGEIKAYLAIIRKTIGFNKSRDNIALSQIAELGNITKKTASLAVKSLEEKQLIQSGKGKHFFSGRNYEINLKKPHVIGVVTTPISSNEQPVKGVATTTTILQDQITNNINDASLELTEEKLKLLDELVKLKVNKPMAIKLVNKYDSEVIKNQIKWINERKAVNIPAYLVRAIMVNYAPPKSVLNQEQAVKEIETTKERIKQVLEQIKQSREFILAGIKCPVIDIQDNMISFIFGRHHETMSISRLVYSLNIQPI